MSGNKSFLKILGCGGDLQIVVFGDSQADGKNFFLNFMLSQLVGMQNFP